MLIFFFLSSLSFFSFKTLFSLLYSIYIQYRIYFYKWKKSKSRKMIYLLDVIRGLWKDRRSSCSSCTVDDLIRWLVDRTQPDISDLERGTIIEPVRNIVENIGRLFNLLSQKVRPDSNSWYLRHQSLCQVSVFFVDPFVARPTQLFRQRFIVVVSESQMVKIMR